MMNCDEEAINSDIHLTIDIITSVDYCASQ